MSRDAPGIVCRCVPELSRRAGPMTTRSTPRLANASHMRSPPTPYPPQKPRKQTNPQNAPAMSRICWRTTQRHNVSTRAAQDTITEEPKNTAQHITAQRCNMAATSHRRASITSATQQQHHNNAATQQGRNNNINTAQQNQCSTTA